MASPRLREMVFLLWGGMVAAPMGRHGGLPTIAGNGVPAMRGGMVATPGGGMVASPRVREMVFLLWGEAWWPPPYAGRPCYGEAWWPPRDCGKWCSCYGGRHGGHPLMQVEPAMGRHGGLPGSAEDIKILLLLSFPGRYAPRWVLSFPMLALRDHDLSVLRVGFFCPFLCLLSCARQ